MTPHQTAVQQIEAGELKVPKVTTGQGEVPFTGYQLAVHVYALKIMGMGMKMRGVSFQQIKTYYGLKGRSAKECVPQLEAILEDYKSRRAAREN